MLKAFGREAVGMEWIEGIAGRVAIGTIRRLESFEREIGSRTSTLSQVLSTLERAGIEFLNGGSPGVRLHPVPAPERRKKATTAAL